MKHLTEMKPGETLHLRSGRDLELESVTPVTCGVMLTFNVTERKEHNNERYSEVILAVSITVCNASCAPGTSTHSCRYSTLPLPEMRQRRPFPQQTGRW